MALEVQKKPRKLDKIHKKQTKITKKKAKLKKFKNIANGNKLKLWNKKFYKKKIDIYNLKLINNLVAKLKYSKDSGHNLQPLTSKN